MSCQGSENRSKNIETIKAKRHSEMDGVFVLGKV
jgi:hypothetical protein